MTDSERYLCHLNRFNGFYTSLTIICISLCLISIAVAIILSLPVGVIIAVADAFLYAFLSTYRAYSLLGLRFKSIRGMIHVTCADCVFENTAFVPDRFVWAWVTHVDDCAFASDKNESLSSVYIPRGIEHIGKDVFGMNASHVTVFFEGDEHEWERIDKETDFSSVTTVFSAPFPRLEKKNTRKCRSTACDAEADV